MTECDGAAPTRGCSRFSSDPCRLRRLARVPVFATAERAGGAQTADATPEPHDEAELHHQTNPLLTETANAAQLNATARMTHCAQRLARSKERYSRIAWLAVRRSRNCTSSSRLMPGRTSLAETSAY